MRRLLLLICCFCLVFSSLSLVACDTSTTETESSNNDTADKENKGEELVEVIRIIDDVKIGGKFTNDRLSVVKVSPEAVPEGAITDVAELKNKYVFKSAREAFAAAVDALKTILKDNGYIEENKVWKK